MNSGEEGALTKKKGQVGGWLHNVGEPWLISFAKTTYCQQLILLPAVSILAACSSKLMWNMGCWHDCLLP